MIWLTDPTSWILLISGIGLSFWGFLIGGSSFLTTGLLQALFPGAGFGTIIGNQKLGGSGRGVGSLPVLWREIEWKKIWPLISVAMVGTIAGASVIARLDPRWLLPAIVIGIFLTEIAPRWAAKFTKNHFRIGSILTGLYCGFLGLGAGVFLFALLRMQWSSRTQIMHIQIQKRVVILILNAVAVVAHGLHGNLVLEMFLPLMIGNMIGGWLSSHLMLRMRKLPGRVQHGFLYVSYAFAIGVAVWRVMG